MESLEKAHSGPLNARPNPPVGSSQAFLLSSKALRVRTTGVADEDHRPTVTHEADIVGHGRDDLTAYATHNVHIVQTCMDVRAALNVKDRSTFWRRRDWLQHYALAVAIS